MFPIDYIYDIYGGTGRLWIFNATDYAIFDVSTGEPEYYATLPIDYYFKNP